MVPVRQSVLRMMNLIIRLFRSEKNKFFHQKQQDREKTWRPQKSFIIVEKITWGKYWFFLEQQQKISSEYLKSISAIKLLNIASSLSLPPPNSPPPLSGSSL